MKILANQTRVKTKNSLWRKSAKLKRRKSPRVKKPNHLQPRRNKSHRQSRPSWNRRQQVCPCESSKTNSAVLTHRSDKLSWHLLCFAAASTPVRSPPTAKPAAKRPASSSTAPASKPAVSLSPAGGRLPKWNPPGTVEERTHTHYTK